MVPNDDLQQALSDVVNAAQTLAPTAAHVRRELGSLLAEAIRLEAEAERIVRALKRLQPERGCADAR